MSGTPRITVVIPCFNTEKYLAAAIRSVLIQDWPGIEIIVVDDGSTDRSAELVKDAPA
jgi:glycosyltransferase involved in cell wall biosynthesis